MTNNQKAVRLIRLKNSYYNALHKSEGKLTSLIKALEEITGKEIQYNQFPGDGLGVVVGDSSVSNYMSINDAIAIIKNKGTLDGSEFTYL